MEEGQAEIDKITKWFINTPKLDAKILPGGGHNFEFCKNAGLLQDAREQFVNSLV
jgi:hypothetical protein